MNIIQPSVELWRQGEDNIAHVARCARICYRKETGNDEKLYDNLYLSKHWSMFRHETYYVIVSYSNILENILIAYQECPYIDFDINSDNVYIVTNKHFILDLELKSKLLPYKQEYDYLHKVLNDNRVSEDDFILSKINNTTMLRYTFKVTTQISTSRELNRVSPNNIVEQSTRYVYEDGTLCCPHWISNEDIIDFCFGDCNSGQEHIMNYLNQCEKSFDTYKQLIDCGIHRQDARGILPIDTATVCAYTYSIKEWKHIIDLRYHGSTGKPHPNAKIIAGMIREKLIDLGHEID